MLDLIILQSPLTHGWLKLSKKQLVSLMRKHRLLLLTENRLTDKA